MIIQLFFLSAYTAVRLFRERRSFFSELLHITKAYVVTHTQGQSEVNLFSSSVDTQMTRI